MRSHIALLEPPGAALVPLRDALRRAGGEWAEVVSVSSASATADADAILVDYTLGDGTRSGAELIRELRSSDADIPLVAVAERGDARLAAEAIAAGATDFLVRGEFLEERV